MQRFNPILSSSFFRFSFLVDLIFKRRGKKKANHCSFPSVLGVEDLEILFMKLKKNWLRIAFSICDL